MESDRKSGNKAADRIAELQAQICFAGRADVPPLALPGTESAEESL
jgi:hypothetical protein